MDYSGLTAFHLSWLYMTVRLAAKLLSNKSDIGEAVFGRRPTLRRLYRSVPRISCPLADGSFGMLLSLTLGVNKHNVAWYVCD